MVSVNPYPAHGFYFSDPVMNMGLPGLNSLPPVQQQQQQPSNNFNFNFNQNSSNTASLTSTSGNSMSIGEDPSKKIRKPYTITKSRESWTEQEHDKFLEALQLFDRDWKKIEAFIGSKTVIQIRSHAQKYFLKVQKSGTTEHVPPPRPKRKAAHPYPQKAPKNAPIVSQVPGVYQPSSCLLEPEFIYGSDPMPAVGNPVTSAAVSSWSFNSVQPASISQGTKDDAGLAAPTIGHNSCYSSSNESTPKVWPVGCTVHRGDCSEPPRVVPDFAQVYSFIGSVFDPNVSGHLEKLKQMDPINLETVLLLMRNLAVNLTSPEFEDHRIFLSSYDADSTRTKFGVPHNNVPASTV